jgi:hypothetical protein
MSDDAATFRYRSVLHHNVSLTKMSADMHGISNSSRHVSIYSISQIRHAEMENTTLLPASKLSGLQ